MGGCGDDYEGRSSLPSVLRERALDAKRVRVARVRAHEPVGARARLAIPAQALERRDGDDLALLLHRARREKLRVRLREGQGRRGIRRERTVGALEELELVPRGRL